MCQNFIRDLRCYGGDKGARNRLDSTGHEFYLGQPYFSPKTVSKLLSIPTINGTLQTDLRQLAEKRSGGQICAAHDLAPLFEQTLAVRWDKESSKGVALHESLANFVIQSPPAPEERGKGKGKGKARQLVKKGSQFFKNTFKKHPGSGDDPEGKGGSGAGGLTTS
jgi:hypothetical protein